MDATSNALDVINAMNNKEAVTDYSPEAVEAIPGAFNDRVLQAIQDEDRIDDIVLHDPSRKPLPKPWRTLIPHGVMSVVHPQHLLL